MSDSPAPVRVTVDRVRHDGVATRVTQVTAEGVDGGRAFVLVAGVGVAATYFEFLAPALAQRGPVYALDLPGFAGMPRPRRQPTAGYFADQVEAVLDHLGLDDPVLLGHSMGAQVVTEVLVRRPHLADAVLVSPVVDEAESGLGMQAVRFAQSASRESPHLALTALSAYVLCGVVYFLTVLPHMLRYRIGDRLSLVRARTLLIRGEHDRSSPRRFHTRLAERVDAWRWEIGGAAHSVINGHAVGVADLVLRHLDGTLPRRGRMSDLAAAVPPAPHADITMLLRSSGSRLAEWVATLRRDEDGVARAKATHAQLLWEAYAGGPPS